MQQHIIRSAAFFNPLSTQNYYTMFYTSVKHLYGKLNSLGLFPGLFSFRFLVQFWPPDPVGSVSQPNRILKKG